MVEGRRDIAMPELTAEAEADRQIEHDVDIGPGFAARRHYRRAELHQLAGVLIEPEADAQPFPLPGAGYREHDVSEGGGRRQVRSVCTWNSRRRNASAPRAASGPIFTL